MIESGFPDSSPKTPARKCAPTNQAGLSEMGGIERAVRPPRAAIS
jgi:hypothetical protein